MKQTLILLLLALQTLAGPGKPLLELTKNASLPRFTTDALNRPVLSWVEKSGDDAVLCFIASTDGGRTFGAPVRVPTPKGTALHTEGRPKIAFRRDGTIFVTFEVRRPTEAAPRAGDILVSTSADGGRHWTPPQPLHRDVRPGGSHSFHDLTRLPSGEVGAVWLDEKLPGREGRTVKFAQTGPDGRFGPEVLVDSSACQCCRTSLVAEPGGSIHLAYRDLLPDGSRDMSHAVSTDGGRTFAAPQLIHADGWKVEACPHSGPQLAAGPDGVWVTWFSGVPGGAGIRLKALNAPGLAGPPLNPARHFPQLAVLPDGQKALCWEEWVGEGPDAYRKVGLQLGTAPATYLTRPGELATQPTLLPTPAGLLVAYTRLEGTRSSVVLLQL